MIEGVVTDVLEAVVSLPVRGPEGREQMVDAVLDTGYSGTLTLPPTLVAELDLPYVIRSRSALADGTVVAFNVHGATVVWDGRPRYIDIDAVGVAPLLGMSMLEGHELQVEVNDGGRSDTACKGSIDRAQGSNHLHGHGLGFPTVCRSAGLSYTAYRIGGIEAGSAGDRTAYSSQVEA